MKIRWFLFVGLMAIALFALGQATDFPNHPIKVIVMTTPGSSADSTARVFCDQLSGLLGQPCIVENRPGADGAIGVMAVTSAPPDGYTILLGSNSPLSANPIVKKDLPYNAVNDLRPVFGLFKAMNAFIVAGDSTFNTLADLVNAAKKAKEPLNVGTSFAGYRLDVKWFASLAGVMFNDIPYKGTAQVVTDVMGHQLDFGFVDRSLVGPLLKSGKIKLLAVGGETRYPDSPEVPTAKESGYPEFLSYAWTAFFVPSKTPDDVVTKLAGAVKKASASNAVAAFIKRLGAEPMPLGPMDMRQFLSNESARYQRVAKAAGIKPE